MASLGYELARDRHERTSHHRQHRQHVTGTSAIANGGTFCVPIGDIDLIYSNCDKLDWVNYKYLVCHADANVSARTGSAMRTTSEQRRLRLLDLRSQRYRTASVVSTPTRERWLLACNRHTCRAHEDQRLEQHRAYPAHPAERVDERACTWSCATGTSLAWGPACTMKIDAARRSLPTGELAG